MKVIVIGETCKDRFVYVDTKRLSPEAPVPVLTPIETTENKGMSGNVVENLRSLGIRLDEITHWHQNQQITKIRYVDKKSNHMFIRVDEGESDIEELVLDNSKINELQKADAVIVSDYDKGFISDGVIKKISQIAKFSIIDTKRRLGSFLISDFDFVKLNEYEYSNLNIDQNLTNKILITLGNKGAKHNGILYPSPDPKETIDVSGAGDTFTSAFTVKYLETKDIRQSIIFANEMSAIVVSKRGVATP